MGIKGFSQYLNESLTDPASFVQSDKSEVPAYVAAQYEFELDNRTYAVRFFWDAEGASKKKMASRIKVGKKVGKRVTGKITSTGNARKLLATLGAILKKQAVEPASVPFYGYVIDLDEKTFGKVSGIFLKYIKKELRSYFNYRSDFFWAPGDSKYIYLWKRGKQFDRVFSLIPDDVDVSDEGSEPAATSQPSDDTVADEPASGGEVTTSSQTDSDSLDVPEPDPEPETVDQTELGKNPDGAGYRGIHEKFTDMEINTDGKEAYLELIRYKLFTKVGYSKHHPMSADKLQLAYAYAEKHIPENSIDDIQAALNMKGYKTSSREDLFSSRASAGLVFLWKRYDDLAEKIEQKEGQPDDDELLSIIRDPEAVWEKAGFPTDRMEKSYFKSKITTSDSIKSSAFTSSVNTDELSFEEHAEVFASVAISYGKVPLAESLGRSLFDKADTASQLDEVVKSAPEEVQGYVDHGLFRTDPQKGAETMINSWTMMGGSSAQGAALVWLNDELANAEAPELWTNPDRNVYDGMGKSELGTNMMKMVYEHTQNFLKQKYGKKYDKKMLTLYRGIGTPNATKYVPGAIESWTTQVSTANKFAKMMARYPDEFGTVMMVEVPVTAIWGTFESLKDFGFPDERHLKGKKEHILMGGVLAKYPIKVYNGKKDTSTETIKTFEEWMMTEEKGDIRPMFPNDPNFDEETKEGTGWAIDPNEDKTKGPPDDDDEE